MAFAFKRDKAVASILYILSKTDNEIDFHKLSKILYFADQKHLVKYGRPIVGDKYVPMPFGGVPSSIYDILKSIRSDADRPQLAKEYSEYFSVEERMYVTPNKKDIDMDSLSESDIECLLESIAENKDLSFRALTNKAHDAAYNKAEKHRANISYVDMAQAGGANEAMLEYIKTNMENQSTRLNNEPW